MKKIGFLFPGQGAQSVGMGKDLYGAHPEARAVFDQADQILGSHVSKLCFEGPEDELKKTVNTQVSIFVTSLATLRALQKIHPIEPVLACGLSLGEFTALVALDSISFEAGLKLVARRGALMEQAGKNNPGTMASLLGLSVSKCEEVSRESGAELANSPEQIVISGSPEAVKKACELAKAKGAKRAIPLKVGGAFHSSLMKEAEEGLKEALQTTEIREPKGIFLPNVLGTSVSSTEEIRGLLAGQLTRSVQWLKTMETVSTLDTAELLEIGPGRVLKGLARKTAPKLTVANIGTKEELDQWTQLIADGCK
jgi:[acyl-carrier-protein] S-malonyltransferase